jgi:hypothetical protein
MIDTDKYKPKIRQYLQLKGVEIITTETPNRCHCPNPTHADKNPSAIIYDSGNQQPGVWCSVCDKKWDIFAIAGLLCGISDFKDQASEVMNTLGEFENNYGEKKEKEKEEPVTIKPLDIESARKIFNMKMFEERGIKFNWGKKVTGAWPYINENGLVEIIDIRFEGGSRKKNVLTFYYDGKYVKSKNAPVKIYGLNKLKQFPKHKRLIVEGAKTAKAGEALEQHGFTVHTWNGGSAKILKADWTIFFEEDCYCLPDDDHEINQITNEEWEYEKQPGMKAALKLKTVLQKLKIVPYYVKAREIKKSGADLVEVLQLLKPEELAKYIIESSDKKPPPREKRENADSKLPFRILGTAEDGKSYFIDRHGRLYNFALDTITPKRLQILASIPFWKQHAMTNKLSQEDWLYIMDDIIQLAGSVDFDTENIRGRGAWHEPDGRICYHDGRETIGEYDKKRVYIVRTKMDIGLNDIPANDELCETMKNIIMSLSFETKTDAVRCMGWAVLAPFGGCLEWRPPILITGPSGSGKTTLANKIIRPLAHPLWLDGTETTPAYLRGKVGHDSRCVAFEEVEGKSEKQKSNREDLFTLMRISFSEDSPDSGKGTQDGGFRESKSRNMFAFIAIDPTMENVANENRMFYINMRESTKEEQENYVVNIEPKINSLFDEKNCRAIRSLAWKKIKIIISFAKIIAIHVARISKKDYRHSHAEALLIAAYFVVFKGIEIMSDEVIADNLKTIIELQPQSEKRDDAEEMVNLILEEKIRVFADKQTEYSIHEALEVLRTGNIKNEKDGDAYYDGMRETTQGEKVAFTRATENCGVYMLDGFLCIANNHKEICRILRSSKGYAAILKRHKKCIETARNINRNGIQKRCTVLDIFDAKPF